MSREQSVRSFALSILAVILLSNTTQASDIFEDTLTAASGFKIEDVQQMVEDKYRSGMVRSQNGYFFRIGPESRVAPWQVSGRPIDEDLLAEIVRVEEEGTDKVRAYKNSAGAR